MDNKQFGTHGNAEVEELKNRIHSLEQKLESQTKRSRVFTIIIVTVAAIFALLMLVGVMQFISGAQ